MHEVRCSRAMRTRVQRYRDSLFECFVRRFQTSSPPHIYECLFESTSTSKQTRSTPQQSFQLPSGPETHWNSICLISSQRLESNAGVMISIARWSQSHTGVATFERTIASKACSSSDFEHTGGTERGRTVISSAAGDFEAIVQ